MKRSQLHAFFALKEAKRRELAASIEAGELDESELRYLRAAGWDFGAVGRAVTTPRRRGRR